MSNSDVLISDPDYESDGSVCCVLCLCVTNNKLSSRHISSFYVDLFFFVHYDVCTFLFFSTYWSFYITTFYQSDKVSHFCLWHLLVFTTVMLFDGNSLLSFDKP